MKLSKETVTAFTWPKKKCGLRSVFSKKMPNSVA